MKVKVVKSFIDKYTDEVHNDNEIFECTEDRYREILGVGRFVEEVKEVSFPKNEGKKKK